MIETIKKKKNVKSPKPHDNEQYLRNRLEVLGDQTKPSRKVSYQ